MSVPELRKWQKQAILKWAEAGHRGIVSVVTGGGKTVFALACIDLLKPLTTLIVVPTSALLDQWWSEVCAFFSLRLDDVHIVTRTKSLRPGTINVAVLNTAAGLLERKQPDCFLIVDECHKAASSYFRRVLNLPTNASLGLSATPDRPYDEGLADVLIPSLGPVIYTYDYAEARSDGVIVPFALKNIIFELESERQDEYEKLTRAIARTIEAEGADSPKAVALLLRRARVLNLSEKRVFLAAKLVLANAGKRTLVFHEDINACQVIASALARFGVASGIYHSRMPLRTRAKVLNEFRNGSLQALVTCRALDEGFNVPETEIGIIAASTATRRQRIQRLGRILRPAEGKKSATVYTLVASASEVARLKEEEENLDGVAKVSWRSE
ncbi:MAG TPA: DEAD/DEAH box helicase [Terriglobales bacterium]|nr:DEAD/DEAH box helicase [Terriglobales bacterium]